MQTKSAPRACASLTAAALTAVLLQAPLARSAQPADADSIRELRALYNQAIEGRRPEAFARFLAPAFTEMVSTGAVTRGAEAVAASYAATEFHDPAFIAYDRRPDAVEVSASRRFAVERGRWRARFRGPGSGETGASGVYQAGWIRTAGGWRLQTEAYVQLTCAHEPTC